MIAEGLNLQLFYSLNYSQGVREWLIMSILPRETEESLKKNDLQTKCSYAVLLAQPSTPPPQGDCVDSRAMPEKAFRAGGLLLTTSPEWATFFARDTWLQKWIVDFRTLFALSL